MKNYPLLVVCFAMLAVVAGRPVIAQDDSTEPAGDRASQRQRMQLDATSVTGNSELPKLLYIVPWQEAAVGKVEGRPVDSLIDELLAPVDRDTFSRELRYYTQLEGEETTSTDVDSEE